MNAHSIFYYTRRHHKVGGIASEIVLVFNDVRFSFRLIKNSIIFFFCICLLPLHDTLFDNNHVAYFCNEKKKYIYIIQHNNIHTLIIREKDDETKWVKSKMTFWNIYIYIIQYVYGLRLCKSI